MTFAKNLELNVALNPSWITREYFEKIIFFKNALLSGEKGVGKSFSFLIYDYFSSFMHQYLLKTPEIIHSKFLVHQ